MDGSLPMPVRPMPQAPADDADDAALARQAAAGSRAAFALIYRRHVARVHGVLLRLCAYDHARAEELAQDVFVQAWCALPRFRAESALGTWLHRIAVNAALAALRVREPARDAAELDADWAAAATPCPAERAALERAIAALPPRARSVLVLHDIEGWTHEEIAAALGIVPGSCKTHLHRARQLLRAQLGGDP